VHAAAILEAKNSSKKILARRRRTHLLRTMRAIVRTQGTQIFAEEGAIFKLNRFRGANAGDTVVLDEVLMVGEGAAAKLGSPLVAGAKVTAKIVENSRGKKVLVMKRLRRKGAHKKRGHRQELSTIEIISIEA
jgi:large subunit ribosomal protein L21